ncbi:hypothetical protein BH09BAC1_BH09BAC1_16820 [soil metagenome]
MTRIYTMLIFFSITTLSLYAQGVGINTNTPDASTSLHVAGENKGILIPMTALSGATDQSTVVGAPYITGMLIYNSATVTGTNAVSPGYYYWTGSRWARMVTNINSVTMEDRGLTTKNSGGTWSAVSNTSGALRVESGNTVVVRVDWRARFSGGDGTDDVSYRIYATGSSGCTSVIGDQLDFRPSERSNEHDNFMPFSFSDTFTAPCSGNMTFRLEAQTTGSNDNIEVDDVVIVVTVY